VTITDERNSMPLQQRSTFDAVKALLMERHGTQGEEYLLSNIQILVQQRLADLWGEPTVAWCGQPKATCDIPTLEGT
jgi:hypothetical protein